MKTSCSRFLAFGAKTSRMLAVVIEDEISICLIYRRVLEKLGYEVIEALDGEAALSVLSHCQPQIIFLDMLLPKVSGVTVLNYITTTPHLAHVPTVIVSSNKQFESLVCTHPSVDFVLKPIRPEQIRHYALNTSMA